LKNGHSYQTKLAIIRCRTKHNFAVPLKHDLMHSAKILGVQANFHITASRCKAKIASYGSRDNADNIPR
jgi:hypothetical protein